MSNSTQQQTLGLKREATEVQTGDVLKQERNSTKTLYEVVYVDQHKVLLRSNSERLRKGGPEYRMEEKDTFERHVDSGFFEPAPQDSFEQPGDTAEDWTDVGGVGEQTNENLHENGYKTKIDIRQADVDDLLEIGGVGEKTAKNLKMEAR